MFAYSLNPYPLPEEVESYAAPTLGICTMKLCNNNNILNNVEESLDNIHHEIQTKQCMEFCIHVT